MPQLNTLITEHGCVCKSKGKDGVTAILLYFESEELRTEFVTDLKARFPAFTGLGIRLIPTAGK
jgi:hypothetical protein